MPKNLIWSKSENTWKNNNWLSNTQISIIKINVTKYFMDQFEIRQILILYSCFDSIFNPSIFHIFPNVVSFFELLHSIYQQVQFFIVKWVSIVEVTFIVAQVLTSTSGHTLTIFPIFSCVFSWKLPFTITITGTKTFEILRWCHIKSYDNVFLFVNV